jgi:hypothetical protein
MSKSQGSRVRPGMTVSDISSSHSVGVEGPAASQPVKPFGDFPASEPEAGRGRPRMAG